MYIIFMCVLEISSLNIMKYLNKFVNKFKYHLMLLKI